MTLLNIWIEPHLWVYLIKTWNNLIITWNFAWWEKISVALNHFRKDIFFKRYCSNITVLLWPQATFNKTTGICLEILFLKMKLKSFNFIFFCKVLLLDLWKKMQINNHKTWTKQNSEQLTHCYGILMRNDLIVRGWNYQPCSPSFKIW